jgi:hypothetical protein
MTVTDNRLGQSGVDTHADLAESVQTSPQAREGSASTCDPPAGSKPASSQTTDATQSTLAAGSNFPADQLVSDIHETCVGGDQNRNGSATTSASAMPMAGSSLADPFLALAADVLDDAERTRIANENRLRQLTRTETDADGEERGFGLDESHPDVARLAALVEALKSIEHQATLNLNRLMRKHPLGVWGKQQKGVGEKQFARLLAVIGDPYWNTLHDRPRTVSELWAYCGLHTLPVGHSRDDAQRSAAGGSATPASGDHACLDAHGCVVAARRAKGQKANWSTTAKTRAYLIAESMLKAGNRETYDTRKAATKERVHAVPCAPCGPKGKPAAGGSPWSLKHRHVDAMRIQSKALLRDLWRESKRIHKGEA